MPVMMSELYSALREAGVEDGQARKAAVEVAEFRENLSEIKSNLRVVQWVVTFNTAMLIALVGKAFLT